MTQFGGNEYGAARDGKKAALKETAAWIDRQIEHVWRAMGIGAGRDNSRLDVRQCGTKVEYGFVYRGRLLARARSYFSVEENRWRFELMEVDQEYYPAVREYFIGEA